MDLVVNGGPSQTLSDGASITSHAYLPWLLRDFVFWRDIRKLNRKSGVRVVQIQNSLLLLTGLLCKMSGFRVIFDAIVVESDFWKAFSSLSIRVLLGRLLLPVAERILVSISDETIALSDEDARRLEKLHHRSPGGVRTIPLSILSFPAASPSSDKATRARPNVLFVGAYSHPPNKDAIDIIVREIRPRVLSEQPDAVFTVVGRGLPVEALRLAGLDAHANVPSVFPFIDLASVCIAPILIGSGVRTKVLEYVSRGKPVVATPVAISGMNFEPNVDLLVANDYDAFARAVVAVLQDPVLREAVGAAGLRRFTRLAGAASRSDALKTVYGTNVL